MADNMTVGVDRLETALASMVEMSIRDIDGQVKKDVAAAGRASVSSLKSSGAFGDVSGKYRKGWRCKVEGDLVRGYESTVHQAAQPTLTHLLEFGHGGPQPAPPHPHIEQAYEAGATELERRLAHG